MTKKEKAIFQRYRERVSSEYRAELKAVSAPTECVSAAREKWQLIEDLYEDLENETNNGFEC